MSEETLPPCEKVFLKVDEIDYDTELAALKAVYGDDAVIRQVAPNAKEIRDCVREYNVVGIIFESFHNPVDATSDLLLSSDFISLMANTGIPVLIPQRRLSMKGDQKEAIFTRFVLVRYEHGDDINMPIVN